LAIALSKHSNIETSVYEAAEQFKEIGAGVLMWERTWKILASLGLSEQLLSVANGSMDGSAGDGFVFRRSDAPSEGFQFCLFETPYGSIRFHRAHLLDIFVNNLPPGVAHFHKKLSSYIDEPKHSEVILNFSDGTKATCDVLVGCDGIKSTVRKQMFESLALNGHPQLLQHIEPRFSGTFIYRALISLERLCREAGSENHQAIHRPMIYCGHNKHLVAYCVGKGSIINVVGLVYHSELEGKEYNGPWVQECTQGEFMECYRNWEPEVDQLIRCVDKATHWAIHELDPLPRYVSGRVALLGDAAHAMTTSLGAGACQAIEDAYILAAILGDDLTTTDTLREALSAYEHVRLPVANDIVLESHKSGLMYNFNSEHKDNYNTLQHAIVAQWKWLDATSPQDEVERALEYMKTHCSTSDGEADGGAREALEKPLISKL